jgi:CHAT domain-containing protein/Flp pilus assembly protein TadD
MAEYLREQAIKNHNSKITNQNGGIVMRNLKSYFLLVLFFGLVGLFTASGGYAEEDHRAIWSALSAKVRQTYNQGKYAEGIEYAKKAFQYAEKHFGKEHPDTLTSLNNLAVLYMLQGRYGEAEPLYKEGLQVCERVLGKEHPHTLIALKNLAMLYQMQGRYGDAEPLYKEALQLGEKVLGKEHPDTLVFLNNLAALYKSQGRYGEAEPLYQEALQVCAKVLGKEHPDTLSSLNNLAGLYDSQGRYGEAEPLYKEALQLCEKVLGKEHPNTLSFLNNLAALYKSQGRYGEAEPLYKEALQLREKVLGKEHPDTLTSLNNLAGLYHKQGRYGEAEPLYKEALQIKEQVLGKEHPSTLTSLNNLAALYESQGRYGEAEPLYQEALQLREKVLGKEHPSTLTSLNNLAGLYRAQGRYGEAEPLYKEFLQLCDQALGKYHPNTLTFLSNYIILLVNMEKPKTAFRLLKKMEDRLFSRSFQELYSTSEDRIRRLFLKNLSDFQDISFSFAKKFPENAHIRYATDVALRWKQVYAEEYAFQHKLLSVSDDPAIKKLRAEIGRLRSAFSSALYQKDQQKKLPGLFQALNKAEAELRGKARSLRSKLQVSGENTDMVLRKLPEKNALIEFKRFSPVDFKEGEFLSPHWGAYLLLSDIDADQQVFFEDLGSEADLIKIMSESLSKSGDPMQGLYTMLFSRFEKHLKNVNTLYIAPDGFLNILPFASLKTPDGQYLTQKFTIKQLQSGRDLLDTNFDKADNTLIALGGVDYGQMPGIAPVKGDVQKSLANLNLNLRAATELDKGLKYLPHSLKEVGDIETLFKSNCKDGTARIYTDVKAGEDILKNLKKAPRILHLSTHGFFLQQSKDSQLAEEEPMVLSGLALAGANQGLKGILDKNGDDGLLYSLEVLGLNLQGTELVSLSACETGKGVIDYSEGVYGLIRAFRTAGAKNVLMTLTPVGDEDAKVFMVKFYEKWLTAPEGTSPSEALNQTWKYFIEHTNPEYRKPGFWSPYVMIGL